MSDFLIYFAVFLRVSPSYQVGVTFNGISNATASCTVLFPARDYGLMGTLQYICESVYKPTHTDTHLITRSDA